MKLDSFWKSYPIILIYLCFHLQNFSHRLLSEASIIMRILALLDLSSQRFILSICPLSPSHCSKNGSFHLHYEMYKLKMFFLSCSLIELQIIFFLLDSSITIQASNCQGKGCMLLLPLTPESQSVSAESEELIAITSWVLHLYHKVLRN